MSATLIFWILWMVLVVNTISFAVMVSILKSRLANQYPALYAKAGSPRILSRSTGFLWTLKGMRAELAGRENRLLSQCLVLLGLGWGFLIVLISCAVFFATSPAFSSGAN